MKNIEDVALFVQQVQEMRSAQIAYHTKQCGRTYKERIFWEEKVDKLLEEHDRQNRTPVRKHGRNAAIIRPKKDPE